MSSWRKHVRVRHSFCRALCFSKCWPCHHQGDGVRAFPRVLVRRLACVRA